jgi:hypothetical protein
MSGKTLLVGVVAIVIASGAVSILAGLDSLVRSGQLSGSLLIGLTQIGLAVWLYRGANAARIILAVLYAFGTVLSVGFLLVVLPPVGREDMIIWTVVAVLCAPVLWVLLLSKPFRAALAANAERFGRNAAQP